MAFLKQHQVDFVAPFTPSVAYTMPDRSSYYEDRAKAEYDNWRSEAELRLRDLKTSRLEHELSIIALDNEIEAAMEELANAASGGTMWRRSLKKNSEIVPITREIHDQKQS